MNQSLSLNNYLILSVWAFSTMASGASLLKDSSTAAWHIPPNAAVTILSHSDPTFNLMSSDLPTETRERLISRGLNSFIALTPKPSVRSPAGVAAMDFEFAYADRPICRYRVRSFKSDDGQLAILGHVPVVHNEPADIPWPSQLHSIATLKQALSDTPGVGSNVTEARPCWLVDQGSLMPAWKITFGDQLTSAIAYADDWKVYGAESRLFDIDGTAIIYPRDHTQNEDLQSFTLKNLSPSTVHLQNSFFTTKYENAGTYGISRASPTTPGTRIYDYSDDMWPSNSGSAALTAKDHFAEVSAFTNLNRVLEFFQGLGYDDTFLYPMQIVMNYGVNHSDPVTFVNNAAYTVEAYSGRAQIVIGDGDGEILQNLPLSLDVMAHEFSHHIIYQTIWSTSGESAEIHEGLADFFTNMMTNDSCLAPSICGVACFTPDCLRTSDNNFAVYEPIDGLAWQSAGLHLRSQVLSGFLWKLQAGGKVDQTELTSIVFEALKYLPPDASYSHLLAAMVLADKNLYDLKNSCTIVEGAEARNLIFPGSVPCDASKSEAILEKDLANGVLAGSIGKSKSTSENDDSSLLGCGVIQSEQLNRLWLLFLWFLAPLALTPYANRP